MGIKTLSDSQCELPYQVFIIMYTLFYRVKQIVKIYNGFRFDVKESTISSSTGAIARTVADPAAI